MATEKKLLANRQNALKSTGPRTAEGKRISSQNAVTHGLLSRSCLLPGEEASELDTLRADLMAELSPISALETMWVDVIVATLWKWRRLNRLEQSTFEYHQNETREIDRYSGMARPRTATEEFALVVSRDASHGDQLGRSARYEVMLERRLTRAIHELQRLQAARDGVSVPPPVAVDVTVSARETVGPPAATSDERDGPPEDDSRPNEATETV